MPWPQPTDYNAAVQSPRACFVDADLRQGQAAGDLFGLPRPHAGNFADVYQIHGADGQSWAVKCFTREVSGLRQRYQAISDHLRHAQRAFMVDFKYLEEGMRIRGRWFPALKMRWVEGLTLNAFLREHADKPPVLERLAQMWLRLAQELREARVAHGDLQHGNVLLVARTPTAPGRSSLALKLIDYDGMHVPELAASPSGEVGHPNYQHPQRVGQGIYDSEVDRFSHLVIYTALRCLVTGGRALWERYDNSENLLFRHEDFRQPRASRLFRDLWALPDPEVRPLVGRLLLAAQGPYAGLPLLDDLVCPGPAADDAGSRARPAVLPLTAGEEAEVRALLRVEAAPRRTRIDPGLDVGPALPDYPVGVALAAPAAVATEIAAPVPTMHARPAAAPPSSPVARLAPARPAPALGALRRLGRLAARRPAWVGGIAAAVVAAVVLASLVSSIARRPRPVTVPHPRLLALDPVVLKGGHRRELLVRVERDGDKGPFTLRLDGVPPKVTVPTSPAVPAGQDAILLPLTADRDAGDLARAVTVTLWQGDEQAGKAQEFKLTVRKFHWPQLRDPSPVALSLGRPLDVSFPVDPNGCDEPLTVRLEDAPAQVRQEVLAVPAGSKVARLRLTAGADAVPGWSFPRVVLSADGLRADTRLVKLTVEGATPPVRLAGALSVSLKPGETQKLTVKVNRRNDKGEVYKGEVEVGLDVFPPWLGWTPATIPPGADSATLELEAGEGATGRAKAWVQVFVEGRKADAQTLWVTVEGAAPAPARRGARSRKVRFSTADHADLRGTFYPGAPGAGGLCVLLLHDLSGGRHHTAWEPLAEALQAKGHAVLRFDFRGHGESTAVAPGFWDLPHNRTLAGYKAVGGVRARLPEFIHAADFPPAYIPRLAEDVAAARAFLERLHDSGEVNTDNLVVIGAGQGATLGALWLAAECHRYRLTPGAARRFAERPEGRRVAAAVWLSVRGTLGNRAVPLTSWLHLASRDQFVPMTLVHGEEDRIGNRWARYVLEQMKIPPDLALTTRTPVAGTRASGEELLRKDLATRDAVLTYLATVVEVSAPKPWVAHRDDKETFYWVFEKREVLAKPPGRRRNLLPLNLLGVTP